MKAWFEPHLAPRRLVDGYFVPRNALLPAVRVDDPQRQVLVGAGARLAALQAAGRVLLSPGVHVEGPLRAGAELILGARCRIDGPIHGAGRVVVQASQTQDIDAAGDVLLLGGGRVGNVRSGGDIRIVGEPKTGRLEPQGRVASRPW